MERSIRRLRSHKSPNTGGMLQGRKTAGIDLKKVSMKNHKAARLNVCTHMIRGMQDFTSMSKRKSISWNSLKTRPIVKQSSD